MPHAQQKLRTGSQNSESEGIGAETFRYQWWQNWTVACDCVTFYNYVTIFKVAIFYWPKQITAKYLTITTTARTTTNNSYIIMSGYDCEIKCFFSVFAEILMLNIISPWRLRGPEMYVGTWARQVQQRERRRMLSTPVGCTLQQCDTHVRPLSRRDAITATWFINKVNLRRTRLVLRWVTVFGFNSRYRTFISACNQLPRPTQPSIPPGR